MVAGIGVRDMGILPAGPPVKAAAVHNDAAQGGAVAADELGGGVDHHVRAVLNGPDQVGGAEGVVNDQGQAVPVSNGRHGVDVGDIAVGIAQGLNKNGLGIVLDRRLCLLQVVDVHKGGLHTVDGQGVGQQVVGAAVDGLLGDNVVAHMGQRLEGIRNSGSAGGSGQRRRAALQRGDPLLQHVLGGVCETAIDIAAVGQVEAGGGVSGIAEDVGGGLIDGHRPGVGGGVGLLLAYMELQGFKFIAAHCYLPLVFIIRMQ